MEDMLYTAAEVASLLKTNVGTVHKYRKAGLLPFLKLGCYKCRKKTIEDFLERYEGKDITDPYHVMDLESDLVQEEVI